MGRAAAAADGAPPPAATTDGIERLAHSAITDARAKTSRLGERLQVPTRALDAVYQRLAEAPPALIEAALGAEWLLDNHYIVRRATRLLEEDFPVGFERRLPRLSDGDWKGSPRAYALAREIVKGLQSQLVDQTAAEAQVRKFQSGAALTTAELWALPALLRLALLEQLACAAELILQPIEPIKRHEEAQDEGLEVAGDPGEVVAQSIRSLQALETADWKTFFESLSTVEQVLRSDPAQIYGRMDFETRDRYRKAVEELAFRSPESEEAIATAAVRLASVGTDRTAHVGYYLIDAGRPAFERQLGYRHNLLGRVRRALRRRPAAAFLGPIALLTALVEVGLTIGLVAYGASFAAIVPTLFLFLVPAITVAVSFVNAALTRLLPAERLPKMDFDKGIPSDCRTLVAVPVLLTGPREIDTLLESLEIRFLGNRDAQLQFALLSDFADADREELPSDAGLLERARQRVEAMNVRYGVQGSGPFHLLHRSRRWNAGEQRWIGWERKRGKLTELNRMLLENGQASFAVQVGNRAALEGTRFVIVLDADTELPRDAARRLVATLAHPLNRAEFDANARVVAGYTVLQPRVEISYSSAESSWFARLCSGAVGLDPYVHAVSDVYQDLFGEGSFVGKGIYDIAAFERTLHRRVPESALLSHDLFEGIHGRAGLVTDAILVEDFPSHYLAYARRLHRWARGDWQLLPWLRRSVPLEDGGRGPNPLSAISRWKIADNLRRSLLPPSLLVFLISGWLWLPGPPLVFTGVALLVLATPGLTDLTGRLVTTAWSEALTADVGQLLRTLRTAADRWLFEIAFLPHQATLLCDAIGRTLVRLLVTRRRLLQWTPAAYAARSVGRQSRAATWREMSAAPALSTLTALLLWWAQPAALAAAAPLLALWFISPRLALSLSRVPSANTAPLRAHEIGRLRRLARETWAFFETHITPADQWLPPDHFQESPRGVVARRTSPTNIGLLLLATTSAYDLGYRGLLWTALRLQTTFDTLDRMERYRGHFFNWYETAHLEPMQPRYVSAVDSGNLAGALVTVKQACVELAEQPPVTAGMWCGLRDTIAVLRHVIERAAAQPGAAALAALAGDLDRMPVDLDQQPPVRWREAILELVSEHGPRLDQHVLAAVEASPSLDAALLSDLRLWTTQLHRHLDRMQRETALLLPWLDFLLHPPRRLREDAAPPAPWMTIQALLGEVPTLPQLPKFTAAARAAIEELRATVAGDSFPAADRVEIEVWARGLVDALTAADQTAGFLGDRLRDLGQRAERFVRETDFGLLYDKRRRLLHLGYDVGAGRLDDNHYDLLASEARLASFLAIAKGDVPQEHWLYLGRPIGNVRGRRALLSWSGTMFEYLMPGLIVREDGETLLGRTCRSVVNEQIAYARRRGIPWGMSEAGYYRLDAQRNYQYRAFGIPTLGFKRGLEDDVVVSPYASLLALRFQPRAVVDNLARLEALGASGRYGFYESVDFTASRLPVGEPYALVREYMAHHQGMILAALNNFLNGDPLVRRFHAEPMARTAELLLYERPALDAPVEQTRPESGEGATAGRRHVALAPWEPATDLARPQVHVLGNGRYTLAVTGAGGGFSRWRNLALTRWAPDPTLDDCGTRLYVRDRSDGTLWSLARDGRMGSAPGRTVFHPHMVELHTQAHGVSAHTRVTVAPDSDVEIRHVRLINEGKRRRYLTVTSYTEVVLGDHEGYRRHPAFSKLFVESEYVRDKNALIFRRRPGITDDVTAAYLLHMIVLPNSGARAAGYETARDAFHGRGGGRPTVPALRRGALSGTAGAVLDPIMALAADVDLSAHGSRQLAFITAVAPTREAVLEIADRYSSIGELDWSFQLARKHSESEALAVDLDPALMPAVQHVLSFLLYPQQVRHDAALVARNQHGRSGLWRFALSGDLPILLVRVQDPQTGPLLHQLVRAQTWWRRRGIMIDLVVLNEQATSYSTPTSDRILRTVTGAGVEALLQRPGGIFVIGADQLGESDRPLLFAAARVVLDANGGSLEQQLAQLPAEPAALPPLVTTSVEIHTDPPLARPVDLRAETPFGGFSADGREYVIHLEPGQRTPAPWVNVIANPGFGFLISEAGGGYTWATNSAENRLTPWSNDPVTDEAGEALYLRDEESGEVWSPTPAPAPAAGAYQIRHGAGYSVFHHRSHGLDQELTLFVPAEDPLKIVRLELSNRAPRQRRLTATFYLEWVLGANRDPFQQFVMPEIDGDSETLMARNPWNEDFTGVAFAAASQRLHGFTGDRTEFLGHRGRRDCPVALARVGLSNVVRPGLDPCAALQVHIDLAPGESRTVHFLLGQGSDRDHALRLVRQYRDPTNATAALATVRQEWDHRLGVVTVRTPEPAFDLMVNRWLLYQTLASRVWGRTGFYQSSGAFGFRDQLQDVAALVHGASPQLARAHLLEAAAHQFREGDVLHWWHPPGGAGVRTRCSDDLLWLPYIAAHYVAATGDISVLHERVPFLDGEPLRPDENERYARFGAGAETGSLYEHCLRAIERADTAGHHGLPLFGSGDWNDGMNRVGREGTGESVWLGWFLYATLNAFAPLCRRVDDVATGDELVHRAALLRQALESAAWDGRWYRRGYYDDGRPLGSMERDECRIDAVAQSWSVISGAGDSDRARLALQAAREKLVREMDGLILLLNPPFDHSTQDPGYIRAYPPGIRENGGHYSHAAAWVVWALAESGNGDLAMQLFQMLLPTHHTRTAAMVARYRVEPYVLAADIYAMPPHTGRGGWTWYTGSSSWVYRLAIEVIVGLRPTDETSWTIDPCIPRTWPELEVTIRDGETTLEIRVRNPRGLNRGVERIVFDGRPLEGSRLPRPDDGRVHRVEVVLGGTEASLTPPVDQPPVLGASS